MGVWKNYDELEEEFTLDELFLTYEKVMERQKRLIETIAAAMGNPIGGKSGGGDMKDIREVAKELGHDVPHEGDIQLDSGKKIGNSTSDSSDSRISYSEGNVMVGNETIIGYQVRNPED